MGYCIAMIFLQIPIGIRTIQADIFGIQACRHILQKIIPIAATGLRHPWITLGIHSGTLSILSQPRETLEMSASVYSMRIRIATLIQERKHTYCLEAIHLLSISMRSVKRARPAFLPKVRCNSVNGIR